MLELQPGMASRICESFKVLHLMVARLFHDLRTEEQPLMPMAGSDTRPKKSVSAHGGTWAIETNPLLAATPSLSTGLDTTRHAILAHHPETQKEPSQILGASFDMRSYS
jgi:hypothetical protein